MKRRLGLMAAVAGVAGLAGAGAAWWKFRPHEVAPDALSAFWPLSWEDPQGRPVAAQGFRGRPLLVNFWATWCPPCVEELPMLNAFYREQRAQGWQVLGLAIDQPAAVRTFLQKLPLDFPVAIGGLSGIDLGKSLGNASGGLPFTVVIGAEGAIRDRKLGQVKPEDLQRWASQG